MSKREKTTNAVEILYRRYIEGKPERLAELEKERTKNEAEIGAEIIEGLTELVDTVESGMPIRSRFVVHSTVEQTQREQSQPRIAAATEQNPGGNKL